MPVIQPPGQIRFYVGRAPPRAPVACVDDETLMFDTPDIAEEGYDDGDLVIVSFDDAVAMITELGDAITAHRRETNHKPAALVAPVKTGMTICALYSTMKWDASHGGPSSPLKFVDGVLYVYDVPVVFSDVMTTYACEAQPVDVWIERRVAREIRKLEVERGTDDGDGGDHEGRTERVADGATRHEGVGAGVRSARASLLALADSEGRGAVTRR